MKVHSNFAGQTSKHRLLALSCATALASFAFIAKPALAEEATADNTANLDTRATTTAMSRQQLISLRQKLSMPRLRQKRLLTLQKRQQV